MVRPGGSPTAAGRRPRRARSAAGQPRRRPRRDRGRRRRLAPDLAVHLRPRRERRAPSRWRGRATGASGRRSTAAPPGARSPRRPPPRPGGWLDPHACSLVGCDLGQWYRVGWASTPPVPQAPSTTAPPAPRIEQAPAPTLTCRPPATCARASTARGERSPDDLGLGASRLAVSDASGLIDFLRLVFPRRIVGAVRDTDAMRRAAPRALVHGPATQPGDDRLVVTSFNRDAMALVRQVVVRARVRSARGRCAGGRSRCATSWWRRRAAGVGQAEVLREDPVPSGAVPVTSADPAAPDDLLVQLAAGAVAVVRAAPSATLRPRVALRVGARRRVARPQRGRPRRRRRGLARGGLLRPRARAASRLGGGAHGGLRARRTPERRPLPAPTSTRSPSGRGASSPSCAPLRQRAALGADPAVLVLPGAPAVALAPWSTLTSADDPACKADPAGWRVDRADHRAVAPPRRRRRSARDARTRPMLARVRWSPARACLEAVEVRTQDMTLSSGTTAPSQSGHRVGRAGRELGGRAVRGRSRRRPRRRHPGGELQAAARVQARPVRFDTGRTQGRKGFVAVVPSESSDLPVRLFPLDSTSTAVQLAWGHATMKLCPRCSESSPTTRGFCPFDGGGARRGAPIPLVGRTLAARYRLVAPARHRGHGASSTSRGTSSSTGSGPSRCCARIWP